MFFVVQSSTGGPSSWPVKIKRVRWALRMGRVSIPRVLAEGHFWLEGTLPVAVAPALWTRLLPVPSQDCCPMAHVACSVHTHLRSELTDSRDCWRPLLKPLERWILFDVFWAGRGEGGVTKIKLMSKEYATSLTSYNLIDTVCSSPLLEIKLRTWQSRTQDNKTTHWQALSWTGVQLALGFEPLWPVEAQRTWSSWSQRRVECQALGEKIFSSGLRAPIHRMRWKWLPCLWDTGEIH